MRPDHLREYGKTQSARGVAIRWKAARDHRAVTITILLLTVGTIARATVQPTLSSDAAPPPSTPQELFNAGTQKLHPGKLREAEAFLESSLSSQTERLQPLALYNLGHVRFGQGVEELKKGPSGRQVAARGQMAAKMADDANRTADEA